MVYTLIYSIFPEHCKEKSSSTWNQGENLKMMIGNKFSRGYYMLIYWYKCHSTQRCQLRKWKKVKNYSRTKWKWCCWYHFVDKNTKPFKALSEQKPNMHLYVGVTKIHRLNPRFNIIHNKGRIFLWQIFHCWEAIFSAI